MNYEQKYKEALERARDVYTYYCDGREQLRKIESIFPELKESDDERIRKELIQYFEKVELHYMNREEILTWLEKQGEQKPSWSEEDKRILEEIIDFFLGDIETRCTTIDKQRHFGYWLRSLKDKVQLQPKQEWNAQDEAFLGDAINAAKKTYSEKCGQEELIDWLKSLKPNHWKPNEELLKDLPKWKKVTEHKLFNHYVCVMTNNSFPFIFLEKEVHIGDYYYIDLEDLKNLPKEE